MRADHVEVLWDQKKGKWNVRITAGDEVIHRTADLPGSASDEALRSAVAAVLSEEGYEAGASVAVQR